LRNVQKELQTEKSERKEQAEQAEKKKAEKGRKRTGLLIPDLAQFSEKGKSRLDANS